MANVKICDNCEALIKEGDIWGQFSFRDNTSLVELDYTRVMADVRDLCGECMSGMRDALNDLS